MVNSMRRATLAAFVAVFGAACAQVPTNSASSSNADRVAGPAGYPAAAAAHVLAIGQTFADGMKFLPPAVGASPAVSASVAYASCNTGGVCDSQSAPDISIASVTIPGVSDSDHTMILGRLAYVFTWAAEDCSPAGPASPSPGTTCKLYNIVDASTGKGLYAVQSSNS